jgi:hypothetical protein
MAKLPRLTAREIISVLEEGRLLAYPPEWEPHDL